MQHLLDGLVSVIRIRFDDPRLAKQVELFAFDNEAAFTTRAAFVAFISWHIWIVPQCSKIGSPNCPKVIRQISAGISPAPAELRRFTGERSSTDNVAWESEGGRPHLEGQTSRPPPRQTGVLTRWHSGLVTYAASPPSVAAPNGGPRRCPHHRGPSA